MEISALSCVILYFNVHMNVYFNVYMNAYFLLNKSIKDQ